MNFLDSDAFDRFSLTDGQGGMMLEGTGADLFPAFDGGYGGGVFPGADAVIMKQDHQAGPHANVGHVPQHVLQGEQVVPPGEQVVPPDSQAGAAQRQPQPTPTQQLAPPNNRQPRPTPDDAAVLEMLGDTLVDDKASPGDDVFGELFPTHMGPASARPANVPPPDVPYKGNHVSGYDAPMHSVDDLMMGAPQAEMAIPNTGLMDTGASLFPEAPIMPPPPPPLMSGPDLGMEFSMGQGVAMPNAKPKPNKRTTKARGPRPILPGSTAAATPNTGASSSGAAAAIGAAAAAAVTQGALGPNGKPKKPRGRRQKLTPEEREARRQQRLILRRQRKSEREKARRSQENDYFVELAELAGLGPDQRDKATILEAVIRHLEGDGTTMSSDMKLQLSSMFGNDRKSSDDSSGDEDTGMSDNEAKM